MGIGGIILPLVSPLSAQADPDLDLYHFSGAGEVCPEIISFVERDGGRVDWGVNNMIAYDKYDLTTQHFQVWIMGSDGTSPQCVTSQNSTLAQIDVGDPAWHPSGNYLVVQAADMPAPPMATVRPALYNRVISPGIGFNNDLWIISTDGKHAAALTHLDNGHGVLHPHFSHSGDLLLWSEMVTRNPQKWVMHIGKFRVGSDGPHLTDVQTLDPLGNAFYEADDFTPDDKQILFSTTKVEKDYRHLSIVRMDLAGGKTTYLTDPGANEWNENARYSPDGKKIIWSSSMGIEQKPDAKVTRNDFWIMNADGTNKHRLTFFNQPDAREFRQAFNIASDPSWSPNGLGFVGYIQLRTKGEAPDSFTGSILRIKLP